MKIAVIDHVGNHGGGSRVVRALLPALKQLAPELEITYFGNPAAIQRENSAEEFTALNIQVRALKSLLLSKGAVIKSSYVRRAIQLLQDRWLANQSWLPFVLSGNVSKEIVACVEGFDLAFYPWPFLLEFPKLDCPSVGIFHDFNYKYYFGGSFVFSAEQRAQLEAEMPVWLANTTPVVSTNFMASELAFFYPEAAHKTKVVHLAPMGSVDLIEPMQAQKVVAQLGIHDQYILYPTHLCSHKNLGPLTSAMAILREQGRQIQLVLTGAGTEAISGNASTIGVRLDINGGDVQGLGYVSNFQMDALVQCALVVVSPSLYEAGNGPGLDGWGRGTPVAMSNIPAFLEHLDVFDVRAQVFDPRSPQDIAKKIAFILDHGEIAREDAEHSRNALSRLTWRNTAEAYLNIFQSVIKQ